VPISDACTHTKGAQTVSTAKKIVTCSFGNIVFLYHYEIASFVPAGLLAMTAFFFHKFIYDTAGKIVFRLLRHSGRLQRLLIPVEK
jgi:hypothetical protein